jgi:TetR/AcrR family transcriptional repressor of uid operon
MSTSAVHSPSRREQQREETRERIFVAAVAEFLEFGFGGAQIPRIAEAAGVVRGTFYFHFPSKEHVLLELVARNRRTLVERLRGLRGREVSLRETLDVLIDASAEVAEAIGEANLLREVLAMHLRASQDPIANEQDILEELTHHVAAAVEREELRADIAPDRLASMVLTSIFGVVMTRQNEGTERRQELALLMDLLLHGMGPRRAGAD